MNETVVDVVCFSSCELWKLRKFPRMVKLVFPLFNDLFGGMLPKEGKLARIGVVASASPAMDHG